MLEYRKRTLTKTISWRTIATLITIGLVYLFTGEVTLALSIGVFEVIAKLVSYYFHERLWIKIRWGKVVQPLAELSLRRELEEEDFDKIKQRLKDLGYL